MERFYPRNLDYIETDRGDLLVVVGEGHPEDRVFSYLKYVQDGPAVNLEHEWHRNGRRYRRVLPHYHYSYIKENIFDYDNYSFYCPVNDMKMTAIPYKDIKIHYNPEIRLRELKKTSEMDSELVKIDKLEKKTIELVDTLVSYSGVDITAFGVTGSILTGIHNPNFSDIDLTVYGRGNSKAVRDFLKKIHEGAFPDIKPLHFTIIQESIAKQSRLFQISKHQAQRIIERRWNQAFFRKTRFSIHPVLPRINRYGTVLYVNCGNVTVNGIITNTDEGLYYPLSWEINIEKATGEQLSTGEDIDLISFEGLYCDVFNIGDRILIEAKLEKMIDPEEESFIGYRLVVGGSDEASIVFVDAEMSI